MHMLLPYSLVGEQNAKQGCDRTKTLRYLSIRDILITKDSNLRLVA